MAVVLPPGQDTMQAWEDVKLLASPEHVLGGLDHGGYEDTPAYAVLKEAGILCTKYRRRDIESIFTGTDLRANTDAMANITQRMKWGYYCGLCCVYKAIHRNVCSSRPCWTVDE
jgi:hypothetical protein